MEFDSNVYIFLRKYEKQQLAIYEFRMQLQIKTSLPQSLSVFERTNPPTQRLIWWEKPYSLIAMYIFPSKHEKQQIATHIFRMQLQIKTPSPKLKCTYKSTYSCTNSFRGLDFHLKFKSSRYYNSQSELQLHIFLMNFLNSFQIGLMGLVFFRFIRFP